MANLSEISRERKTQLRQLLTASRRLDATQEKVEREIKRLVNRKNSVPEVADAARIAGLLTETSASLDSLAGIVEQLSTSWGNM